MNVIAWLEFELAYYDVTAEQVTRYVTLTPLTFDKKNAGENSGWNVRSKTKKRRKLIIGNMKLYKIENVKK